jgi:hypothetical protein
MAWPGNGFIDQMADNLRKPARRLDDLTPVQVLRPISWRKFPRLDTTSHVEHAPAINGMVLGHA